jgi:putative toxin-antitoxin system antitoxin component (TIGR02293 family)
MGSKQTLIRTMKLSSPRLEQVKQALQLEQLDLIAQRMQVTPEQSMQWLGIRPSSVHRERASGRRLSVAESSRVIGLARLIWQIEVMVVESGEPEGFNPATWLAGWLEEPLPALGGRKPAEFMDTAEGQALLSQLLANAQSSAYR